MNDIIEQIRRINEEQREIDSQITPLTERRRELEGRKMELYDQRLKVNVGRCFMADTFSHPGKYGFVKILDIPRPRQLMKGTDYNPYQYPVLYIPGVIRGEEISGEIYPFVGFIPFEEDTLFSRSCDAEDPYDALSKEYQEICGEAFEARFNMVVAEMRRDMAFNDDGNVIHGEWLPVDEKNDAFDCSVCGAMVRNKYKYCPRCGAKMDIDVTHMRGARHG